MIPFQLKSNSIARMIDLHSISPFFQFFQNQIDERFKLQDTQNKEVDWIVKSNSRVFEELDFACRVVSNSISEK